MMVVINIVIIMILIITINIMLVINIVVIITYHHHDRHVSVTYIHNKGSRLSAPPAHADRYIAVTPA
jgi:hypothetical protein